MKFWKNLAICITLALSCFLFNGCNCSGRHIEVSKDLDGDGVISDWETVFESMAESNSSDRVGLVTEISSFDELKAINEHIDEVKFYKLTRNIDCNGEAVCINLGNSVLYGNNKVIKNFKLKELGLTVGEEDNSSHTDADVYGLIYGGSIYDLRLFAGYQNIQLDNTYRTAYVSPFVEVGSLTNIVVKGRIDVERKDTEGLRGDNEVEISLCTINFNDPADFEKSSYTQTRIDGVETIGKINYTEEDLPNSSVRIASVANCLYDNSSINNAKSSVDISAESSGSLIVGGIVAENNDMVSNSEYLGNINATYLPNMSTIIGGIVGRNNSSAEIKNIKTAGSINFETDIVTSIEPTLTVGGVVGRNLGVVNYIECESTINVKKTERLIIGGICGSSEYGIFSNIINRATLNITNCPKVTFAEICATAKRGHFEQIVDFSNTTIDNKTISSTVYLGMVTIFETNIGKTDVKYDAEYSPTFKGIFMTGTVVVNQKKVGDSADFVYNLGLRNPYEYYEVDEAGNIIYKEVLDDDNNPVKDEDSDTILTVPETATRTPDVYSKLYYLENSYSIKSYLYAEETAVPQQQVISYTFAKDKKNSADCVAPVSQSRPVLRFFVDDLGFKYGVNHNEIDLSGCQTVADLTNLKFVLSEEEGQEKYFEKQQYNGELAIFDRYFDDVLTYDEELDKQTEMYSYINYLMLHDSIDLFVPIKVSRRFIECTNPEFGASMTMENDFAKNIKYLIMLIIDAEPTLEEKSASNQSAGMESDNNDLVKYECLKVYDSEYRYYFTFDVSQISEDDVDSTREDYLIFLRYYKEDRVSD